MRLKNQTKKVSGLYDTVSKILYGYMLEPKKIESVELNDITEKDGSIFTEVSLKKNNGFFGLSSIKTPLVCHILKDGTIKLTTVDKVNGKKVFWEFSIKVIK